MNDEIRVQNLEYENQRLLEEIESLQQELRDAAAEAREQYNEGYRAGQQDAPVCNCGGF